MYPLNFVISINPLISLLTISKLTLTIPSLTILYTLISLYSLVNLYFSSSLIINNSFTLVIVSWFSLTISILHIELIEYSTLINTIYMFLEGDLSKLTKEERHV